MSVIQEAKDVLQLSEDLLKLIGANGHSKITRLNLQRAIRIIDSELQRRDFPQGVTLLHALECMVLANSDTDERSQTNELSTQLFEVLGLVPDALVLNTKKRLEEALYRLRNIIHALQVRLHYDHRIPLFEILNDILKIDPPQARAPIPMLIICPECGQRHIDTGEFATKPHHTHACQHCGMTWRPAIVPTVGVQFLPGFKNEDKTT